MQIPWHSLPLNEVFQKLETSEKGLSSEEAARHLKKFGLNTLPKEKPYSKIRLFFSQFNNPLVYILLAACGVSLYLKHYSDSIFIFIVLFINTAVGFYQENKANKSLISLKQMVKISARVIRDGNPKEIDGALLAPGDVIIVKAGDKVPADAKIIKSKGLKADESNITGEWIATKKEKGEVVVDAPLGDRSNMIFMGTIAEEGEAEAVVIETGSRTAIGEVVTLLKETKERKTPLQKKIARLSQIAGGFVLSVIFIVITIGYFRGNSFSEIFVASLALAASATPAGLLPTVTVILVMGMRRILKQNGLVRKLIANETLGSVTVICTDKTGTLTQGKMQVSHILTGTRELLSDGRNPISKITDGNGVESHILALKIATLANDAFIENPEDEFHDWIVRGRPTERALLVAGTHAGLDKPKLEKDYPIVDHKSFDSDLKYAASLRDIRGGGTKIYAVGAPETLISKSVNLHIDGQKVELDSDEYKRLLEKLESLTAKGLRVVACAYREVSRQENYQNIDELVHGLTLVGFIALKDPLREDAKEYIRQTEGAGIRTIIITGDHRLTAQSIANEVGIKSSPDNVIEGNDLDKLSDEELAEKSKDISIYARVSPRHKLRIVAALQSKGEVVAMVGDGVNDAPAIKAADVGIAVGSGTDVAKEAADIVLLDSNFKTIVKAVEQGRVIFQNIRKVFIYLVADDFSELFLFLAAMAFGLPIPLVAAQILWINLVEDGFPGIALTMEQETFGVMEDRPRNPKEPILNRPMKLWMLSIFFITGLAAFLLFLSLWVITADLEKTRTAVFALMCLDSLIFSFSARSLRYSIFRKDIFSNKFLTSAVIVGLLLLFSAIYLPPLQKILSTQPLEMLDWSIIVLVSAIEIILIEIFKKNFLKR